MNNIIKDNVRKVRERIDIAAEKSGRKGQDITLIVVSKLQPVEKILQAQMAGIKIFGENRVQELLNKITEVKSDLTWHLIGHLQSNKVNKVVDKVAMIQSVDSESLLRKLSFAGEQKGVRSDVLLQVNTSGEQSKFGFEPAQVASACELVETLSHINVLGLMTIGPFTDNQLLIGRSFENLRKLSENITEMKFTKINMEFLSMGMTSDYELAVREGSNMVRIGTAVFGSRT